MLEATGGKFIIEKIKEKMKKGEEEQVYALLAADMLYFLLTHAADYAARCGVWASQVCFTCC
jgi:hypothetical protein